MASDGTPSCLRDRLPPDRKQWIDISSSESLGDWARTREDAPVIDSQQSFVDPLRAASLDSLAGHMECLGQSSCSQMKLDSTGASIASSQYVNKEPWKPNANAAEFVPNMTMPVTNVIEDTSGGHRFGEPTYPNAEDTPVVPATSNNAQEETPAVRRRATKKRKKTPAEAALMGGGATPTGDAQALSKPVTVPVTPAGKRSKPDEASEVEPANEEEKHDRWLAKRSTCVEAIKEQPDYKTFSALRTSGRIHAIAEALGVPAPVTPDATDLNLSKRTWEGLTQKWRAGLRQFSAHVVPSAD